MNVQSKIKITCHISNLAAALFVVFVSGCNPATFGILTPGQREWHSCLNQITDKFHEGISVDKEELVEECGQPDFVISGKCFIAGNETLDQLKADRLRMSLEDLYDDDWKDSTILIYDEKKHFLWPIVDSWRAYLFQVKDDKLIYGWSTYPSWIPWSDSYWDSVRSCKPSGKQPDHDL